MGDIVSDILGADFPKVAGLCGLILVLLGVVPGRIWIIPARDKPGRIAALILGCIFAGVPLAAAYFGSTIGLINPTERPPNGIVTEEPTASHILLSPAYAAGKRYTISAGQRSVTDTTTILQQASAVYIGDIHLSRPNLVLFFRPGRGVEIDSGAGLDEDGMQARLSSDNIIFMDRLKQGDTRSFTVDSVRYTLRVDEVIWYIVGDDAILLTVEET
jgi:hypothetical protein